MMNTLVAFVSVAVVAVALSAAAVHAKTVPASTTTVDTRACLPPHDTFPFCNTKLSIAERVADLIGRLQPEEIPPLLTAREGGGGSPPPPGNISRLGLPEYDWGLNCVHGVQSSCVEVDGKTLCPTTFPNPIGYGASFNKTLFSELGRIIADEARALWVLGATEESSWSGRPHVGLDCWSPNINIARDPRWGRIEETPGEDPLLNGLFGKLYTEGMQQGEDSRYVKVITTIKHYDAYSLEGHSGSPITRHNFNAVVSNFSLADTYLPAMQAALEDGKALGVMCSYNALNGIPTCANPFLANTLRSKWGFAGYMTSDTGAIDDIYEQHKYVSTGEEAVAKALVDGTCDMNSGAVYHSHLLPAVQQKLLSMDDVNRALTNTLALRFRLGLFDPIENQPYWHVPAERINTDANKANSRLAADESMVLLQNPMGTLPLAKGKRVAVIGPHANASDALVGNYMGQACPDDTFSCVQTPYSAIAAANTGGSVTSAPGCDVKGSKDEIAAAVEVAKGADVIVLMLGIDGSIEGESHDRTDIDLPAMQHQLAANISALGKPTVIVLLSGGPLSVAEEKAAGLAMVQAFYPGIYGAASIAATVFGDNDHLGGKLPYTIYPKEYTSQIDMTDMELNEASGPGRGYRYYKGTPVFGFGHGMSLTNFSITNVTASAAEVALGQEAASFKVKVTNVGHRTGDEVVQAYVMPPSGDKTGLIKRLVGFERVHLAPGQSAEVELPVEAADLAMVESSGDRVFTPGQLFKVLITNGVEEKLEFPLRTRGATRTVVQPYALAP